MFPILLSCDGQCELAKERQMRIMSIEVWSSMECIYFSLKKKNAIYNRITNPRSDVQTKVYFIAFERKKHYSMSFNITQFSKGF